MRQRVGSFMLLDMHIMTDDWGLQQWPTSPMHTLLESVLLVLADWLNSDLFISFWILLFGFMYFSLAVFVNMSAKAGKTTLIIYISVMSKGFPYKDRLRSYLLLQFHFVYCHHNTFSSHKFQLLTAVYFLKALYFGYFVLKVPLNPNQSILASTISILPPPLKLSAIATHLSLKSHKITIGIVILFLFFNKIYV